MMSSRIPPLTKSNSYTRRNPEQMLATTIEKDLDVSEDSSSDDNISVRSQSTPGLKRKVSFQQWGIPVNVSQLMRFSSLCFLWCTPAAALTRHQCLMLGHKYFLWIDSLEMRSIHVCLFRKYSCHLFLFKCQSSFPFKLCLDNMKF